MIYLSSLGLPSKTDGHFSARSCDVEKTAKLKKKYESSLGFGLQGFRLYGQQLCRMKNGLSKFITLWIARFGTTRELIHTVALYPRVLQPGSTVKVCDLLALWDRESMGNVCDQPPPSLSPSLLTLCRRRRRRRTAWLRPLHVMEVSS